MTEQDVLIIIPTYNERENITLIIPEIKKYLPKCEILVVDDSSPDGTAECVEKLAEEIPGINLLKREKKDGLGKAYISGFQWALNRSFKYIFEMDADFSHDPKYLPDFLKSIENHDLVIGSRYISGVNVVNWPITRLLLSYGGNKFASFITGIPVKDCTGGYKCFRRKILEELDFDKISSSGYSFQVEINFFAWKKGFKIKEIPIIFTDRTRGVSKMSTRIIREALFLVWKLRLSSLFSRKR
ncbi:MAG: polyprenol monophosphomannose synthase [Fibrobacter sp.]|nr:polyprenol monophosphomannose synthase [Fibrobacter sp.]